MGRPCFKPTPHLRSRVATAAGGGMSHEDIALALGISRNTLEKHFAHELSVGASSKRMDAMEGLHRAAKKGNVAAAKQYLAGTMRTAPPPLPDPPKADTAAGKKEQAQAAAKTAQLGTEWEDLLKPTSTTPLQ